MIIIKNNGKRIEYVLKEYRQKISDVGLHRELRDRKKFEKPSAKKRRMMEKAKYKNKHGKKN